jgi:hypothetical protein
MTQTFQIVNGDVAISSSTGRPIMAAGKAKLRQDLQEAGTIEVQPNGFGFGLESVIGLVGDSVSLKVEISRRIRNGITAMIRLQQQIQRAQRTSDEIIARLTRVAVAPIIRPGLSTTAATAFSFQYDVLTQEAVTAGAQPITTGGTIIPPVG